MFFCEQCRRARAWPESVHRSNGRCEVCGAKRYCHDVRSSDLPVPFALGGTVPAGRHSGEVLPAALHCSYPAPNRERVEAAKQRLAALAERRHPRKPPVQVPGPRRVITLRDLTWSYPGKWLRTQCCGWREPSVVPEQCDAYLTFQIPEGQVRFEDPVPGVPEDDYVLDMFRMNGWRNDDGYWLCPRHPR